MDLAAVKDYEDIIAVLTEYGEGCNAGGEMAKKTFHPNALVNGEPAQKLFDAIDKAIAKNGKKGESTVKIDILGVSGNLASARVLMIDLYGMNFIDFHHLMKTDSGWKIVSKIYHDF